MRHVRGERVLWMVDLQNHGGPGKGLEVDLAGPAFEKPALDVVRAEAFFPAEGVIFTARRRKLASGVRFTFDEVSLTPPRRKARRPRRVRGATAADELRNVIEAQLRDVVRDAGLRLRFTCKTLSAPPARALAFTLTAQPLGAPSGGFSLCAWFGRASLMFEEFF